MKTFMRDSISRDLVGPKNQKKVAVLILLAWAVGLSACQDFRANPTEGYGDLGLTEKPRREKPRPQQAYDRLFVLKTNDNQAFFILGQSQRLQVEVRFLQPVTAADLLFTSSVLDVKTRMKRERPKQGDSPQTFRYSLELILPKQLASRAKAGPTNSDVKPAPAQFGFIPYSIEVANVQSNDTVVTALFQSVILEHEGALAFIEQNQGVNK